MQCLCGLQSYLRRIEGRIVGADLVNEAPIARRPRIGDDDTVKRPFLGAMAAQSDHESHYYSIFSYLILAPKPEPAHHRFSRAHLGDFLHHLARLLELLDEAIDFLHRSAAAAGDPRPAMAVEDQMVATLLARHRVDNRGHPLEFALGVGGIGLPRHLLEPRNHAQDIAERAHPADCLELFGEILDRKFILLELALEFLGLALI